MAVHTIFALIAEQEVKNIVVGDYPNCDAVAKSTYGQDAFATEVTQYPVEIGDTYNGVFSRVVNGERVTIEAIPTDRQEIDALVLENRELRTQFEALSSASEAMSQDIDATQEAQATMGEALSNLESSNESLVEGLASAQETINQGLESLGSANSDLAESLATLATQLASISTQVSASNEYVEYIATALLDMSEEG